MDLAIIGCGSSGLSTAKISLQLGFVPTVFERANSVGGLWRPDGFVWKSLQTNISKYSTSFSDFYWNDSSPLFPSAGEVQGYLFDYAKEHKLFKYIQFNSNVTHISYKPDNHQWEVTWEYNSQKHSKLFNYVVVCSGFFTTPHQPSLLGEDGFKGQVIHSSKYHSPEHFKDKRVLVVGSAFSGADIAAEISEVAKETYMAVRRPAYILPRYLSTNDYEHIPLDLLLFNHKSPSSIPCSEEEKHKNTHNFLKTISHTLGLTIDTSSPPYIVISDRIVEVVEKGNVVLCKALQRFDGSKVIFEDERELEVDVVIFATGYEVNLSYFDEDFLEAISYNPKDLLQPVLLHEKVFPQKFPNIAFVGFYRGPYFVIDELQARWVCLVFAQRLPPLSEIEIKKGIEHELELRKIEKKPQYLVKYAEMADHLAEMVGVLPDDKIRQLTLIPAHYAVVDNFNILTEQTKEKAMEIIEKVKKLVSDKKK